MTTRTRVGVALAGVALVGAGAFAVSRFDRSNGPDLLVAADPTVAEAPEETSVDITQVPTATGPTAEWVVPWRDGFLAGSTWYTAGSDGQPSAIDAQFTSDGATWEPIEMQWPHDAWFTDVTTVGDRLVVLYDEDRGVESIPTNVKVATTTDLVSWSTYDIAPSPPPVELPPGITQYTIGSDLGANDAGWVATISQSFDVDSAQLLPAEVQAELDANPDGYSAWVDDAGIEIDTYEDDTDEPRIYSWEELGVAPEVAAYLADGDRQQVWAAAWDGEPVLGNLQPLGAPDQLIATPAGFLYFGDETWFSPDGITWKSSPLPSSDGPVVAAFAVDGGVVTVAFGADLSLVFHRSDDTGRGAEQVDVPGLPDGRWYGTDRGGSAIIFGVDDSAIEPLVVEADGYRLTVEFDGTSELTDASTGELVVSEKIGPEPAEGSSFDVGPDGGLTVRDPANGAVLAVFTNDQLLQASAEALEPITDVEYVPDLWLLATRDGRRFVVSQLGPEPDSGPAPTSVATNADTALVQVGDGRWLTFDLP